MAQKIGSYDYAYIEAALGDVDGATIVHKFGKNPVVGTTFVPVSIGGVYRTPQIGSAATLRVAAGHTNDDALGSGARQITLVGLDATGVERTVQLDTNGITDGELSTVEFIRLYRAYVQLSGTYATMAVGSHSADIVIESTSETWATIDVNDYPHSQSEIGMTSIPKGYTALLGGATIFTDATRITDLLFVMREGILDTAAPYQAARIMFEERIDKSDKSVMKMQAPMTVRGPADMGFMAKVDTSTGSVDVDFEYLLIRNSGR